MVERLANGADLHRGQRPCCTTEIAHHIRAVGVERDTGDPETRWAASQGSIGFMAHTSLPLFMPVVRPDGDR